MLVYLGGSTVNADNLFEQADYSAKSPCYVIKVATFALYLFFNLLQISLKADLDQLYGKPTKNKTS